MDALTWHGWDSSDYLTPLTKSSTSGQPFFLFELYKTFTCTQITKQQQLHPTAYPCTALFHAASIDSLLQTLIEHTTIEAIRQQPTQYKQRWTINSHNHIQAHHAAIQTSLNEQSHYKWLLPTQEIPSTTPDTQQEPLKATIADPFFLPSVGLCCLEIGACDNTIDWVFKVIHNNFVQKAIPLTYFLSLSFPFICHR